MAGQVSMETTANNLIFNHFTVSHSELDMLIIKHVPPGGNWKDIPEDIPSARLDQIRLNFKLGNGSRSTYYGRLHYNRPAYTISTFFNRPGNGCYIHPKYDRLISAREAARLQSFPDRYRFLGPPSSIYKQIGNAIPPLLSRAIAKTINATSFIDLFCGAGGLSQGFEMAGHKCIGAFDMERYALETFSYNHSGTSPDAMIMCSDLTEEQTWKLIKRHVNKVLGSKVLGLVVGGPPCQGFSTAGNKRSFSDPRNALPKVFLDIVSILEPSAFVMEEVPGLLSMGNGKVLKEIKSKGEELGYRCNHMILAAHEYGVPQKRRRLFIFGSRNGKSFDKPAPLFGEKTFGLKKVVTVEESISDLPPIPPGGGSDCMEYTFVGKCSPYQLWTRGYIDFEEMVEQQPAISNMETLEKHIG